MFRQSLLAAVGLAVLAVVPSPAAARTVYMGTDPSLHTGSYPETIVLTRNAVQWVGHAADPAIAYTSCASITGATGAILTAAGFTNTTLISSGSLAAADLSIYDVLYVGVFGGGSCAHADMVAAATNIQSFVDAGGGLVVEDQVNNALSFTWAPDFSLIGWEETNTQIKAIINAAHPVMAGLTPAGLSGWSASVHNRFHTPAAAGFETLAVDQFDVAHIIARDDLPACGNGVVDAGEECDDGNTISGDGCDADCVDEFCGDSLVNDAPNEQCDDGPGNSDTQPDACRTDCMNARCGDGVVDTGEACDDGNNDEGGPGDYCSADCSVSIPAVSEWALVILLLVGLTLGIGMFRRKAAA